MQILEDINILIEEVNWKAVLAGSGVFTLLVGTAAAVKSYSNKLEETAKETANKITELQNKILSMKTDLNTIEVFRPERVKAISERVNSMELQYGSVIKSVSSAKDKFMSAAHDIDVIKRQRISLNHADIKSSGPAGIVDWFYGKSISNSWWDKLKGNGIFGIKIERENELEIADKLQKANVVGRLRDAEKIREAAGQDLIFKQQAADKYLNLMRDYQGQLRALKGRNMDIPQLKKIIAASEKELEKIQTVVKDENGFIRKSAEKLDDIVDQFGGTGIVAGVIAAAAASGYGVYRYLENKIGKK